MTNMKALTMEATMAAFPPAKDAVDVVGAPVPIEAGDIVLGLFDIIVGDAMGEPVGFIPAAGDAVGIIPGMAVVGPIVGPGAAATLGAPVTTVLGAVGVAVPLTIAVVFALMEVDAKGATSMVMCWPNEQCDAISQAK